MPSEFVDHFTRSLELSASRPASPLAHEEIELYENTHFTSEPTQRKKALHALFVSLTKSRISLPEVQKTLESFQDISHTRKASLTDKLTDAGAEADLDLDPEETALEAAIVGKLTVALYCDALDTCLGQATGVEAEAEWWGEVETSRWKVAMYFIETLPIRVFNVARTIIGEARAQRVPLSISTFSPSSLRTLLRSTSTRFTLQPGRLTTVCFPHLQRQQSLSLAVLLASPGYSFSLASNPSLNVTSSSLSSFTHVVIDKLKRALRRVMESASMAVRFLVLPLELTRQECKYKRKELEKIRDQRAEMLGELAQLRAPLADLIGSTNRMRINSIAKREYTSFLCTLVRIVSPSSPFTSFPTPPSATATSTATSPIQPLAELTHTLPTLATTHLHTLRTAHLLRPTLLTRTWPKLLLFPPLTVYIYSARGAWIPALFSMLGDARETVRGFVEGWLVEPLLGVLRTVRAGAAGGSGEGGLVSQEGVRSDLESLNRMTLDLARDALHMSPSQLAALSERVRMGDLTPVMQAYEEDIRTPLRSALRGTLLRNVFIQVQKAKVDIDQALSGIDRLLKSQELTFAFVGVAPALAITWAVVSGVWGLWSGGWERGRYGGWRRRRGAWEGIRRIERILILQPSSMSRDPSTSTPQTQASTTAPIPPLPTGLLVLSLTRLRSFAISCLPEDVQNPFLEDLSDLEDTRLDRDAKLRVVERMWRSWGAGGRGVLRY